MTGYPYQDQCPPLDVLCYAIKNIMYPDFLLCQIPDLLDLLAVVELYRQEASTQARAALVFNDFYQNDDTVVSLTRKEKERIERIGDEAICVEQRRLYTLIWVHLCKLVSFFLYLTCHALHIPSEGHMSIGDRRRFVYCTFASRTILSESETVQSSYPSVVSPWPVGGRKGNSSCNCVEMLRFGCRSRCMGQ